MYRNKHFLTHDTEEGWMNGWMDGWIDGTGWPYLLVNILLFLRSHLFCHPVVNLSWSRNLLGLCPFIILFVYVYIIPGGKQWKTTPKNLPRMQRTRAIPVAWLGSGSCSNWPYGWILIIIIILFQFLVMFDLRKSHLILSVSNPIQYLKWKFG